MNSSLTDRRAWLTNSACGFGSLAFSSLMAQQQAQASEARKVPLAETLATRDPMFPARAKRIIFSRVVAEKLGRNSCSNNS